MTAKPMSYRRARLAAAGAVAVAAFVVACDSQLPTSTEIEAMSVSEVEAQASPLLRLGNAETQYLVDGEIVTREVAAAVPAHKIARIEVSRSVPEGASVGVAEVPTSEVARIHVITTDAPQLIVVERAKEAETAKLVRPLAKGTPSVILRAESDSTSFEGLLVIDGVLVEQSRLGNLDPKSIKKVEVVKGAAGERLYGPRGAKGVILITTKEKP